MKLSRFPMPDLLVHVPKGFKLGIDSIITQGYHSDEEALWADYEFEVRNPVNSVESLEIVDFDSSDENEGDEVAQ